MPDDAAGTAVAVDRAAAMGDLAERLYPLHRSTTGPGLRETLAMIGEIIPLEIHEVPTGTPVLDWTIPREWRVHDAYVADARGRRIIDYAASNLHVVGYSQPIHAVVDRAVLLEHLHTRPDLPHAVPYRTSPFAETWGFCAAHALLETLTEPTYTVHIDAELVDGGLTYGECFLPGSTEEEIVLSTHACHPSLANDNVSGLVVTTFLAAALAERPRRYGIRFLFAPGTLGAITWLSRNEERLQHVRHGLVVAGVGDAGKHTYKQSFSGTATIDRAVVATLAVRDRPFATESFTPWGYDERQFNSPGFRLPFGRLSRTPYGTYPEYHTSSDDLDFIRISSLTDSLDVLLDTVDILERDRRPVSTAPRGEPRLGARGLMSQVGGRTSITPDEFAVLWVLNLADGDHSLLDMAERSGMPFSAIAHAADALESAGLLRPAVP
jgi:aminopeptidase-like protein